MQSKIHSGNRPRPSTNRLTLASIAVSVFLFAAASFSAFAHRPPSSFSPNDGGGNLLFRNAGSRFLHPLTPCPSPSQGRGESLNYGCRDRAWPLLPQEAVRRELFSELSLSPRLRETTAGGATRVGASQSADAGRRAAGTPVILISIDTLRADHLSCYGDKRIHTPHIDAFAEGGTLFAHSASLVPLTFPSHVTLLTSTYPFANGIEDNGDDLPPGAVTLATALKAYGYRTAAFVSTFILDRRFGLNQGFDVYDSPFDLHRHTGIDPGDLKRPASDVESAAARWIGENAGKPFFVFLHFYDLHTPYDPPAVYRRRYPGSGYDAEIAYVDSTLGEFEDFLRQRGLFRKCLIVFTADHGEGLNEHGESAHGYFIYQSTIHVPLIFHWPASSAGFPQRVDAPVSLIDVAPTILQFLGLPLPRQFQGHSLLSEIQDGSFGQYEPIYSESLYGYYHFGTAPLRSLRLGPYKFISAPRPELYNLKSDLGETHNIYGQHRAVAASLREQLHELMARYQHAQVPHRVLSPEAINLLQSLPYVASSSAAGYRRPETGVDPKDRIVQFEEYGRALVLASRGRLSESDEILRGLLDRYPELTDVQITLGINLQRAGRHREAIRNFQKVLSKDPTNVLAHFDSAVSYYALGQLPQAIQEARATLALAPYYTRADALVGTIWIQEKQYERAKASFEHALTYAPNDYTANYNLGVLAALQQDWSRAEGYLLTAVRTEPSSPEAHNTLGSLYMRQGDLPKAQEEFTAAIRLQPKFAWPHYNLGLVFRAEKAPAKAKEEFRRAIEDDPNFQPARAALAGP
jgi:choline-sulfatase